MALDIDRYAHLESPIQRWDARFKIAALLTLILALSVLSTIPGALAGLCVACGLLYLTNLPGDFVKGGLRWVLIFLVPFLIIMPASYPGEASFHLLGLPFAVPGFRLAVLIVIKAVAIVLTAYAIFGTSRFDIAMVALQHLRCPTVFVQMLLFTYRYIFVFLGELQRRDIAMKARGFVARPNAETLKVLGNFVGTLLVRSFERTDRIYKAMLSKGYDGEFRTLIVFRAQQRDRSKAAITATVIVCLIILDKSSLFHSAELGWL
jgi:cobalt/nickel transport system permease protein